jgi:hypothetical protein
MRRRDFVGFCFLGFIVVLIFGLTYFGVSSYIEQNGGISYSFADNNIKRSVSVSNGSKQVSFAKDSSAVLFSVISESGSEDLENTYEYKNNYEEVVVIKNDPDADYSFVVVKNFDLNEGETKIVYLDILSGSGEVCLKDEEIDDISEISENCDGADEVLLSCPGLNGSYECEIIDWEYKVSGLNHSGVKELDFKMTFTARELDPIVFILAGGSNMYGVSSADGLSNKSLLDIPENVDFYYAEQDVGGLVLANSFGEQHYSDGGYHHFGPEVSLINGLSTLYSTRKVVVLKFADFDSGISEWNSDLRDALVDYVNEMTSNYDDFEYGDIFWMQGGSDAIDFEDDYYFLSKSFFEYVNFELGEDLRVFMIQVPSEDNNCLWGELSYDDSKNIDKIWLWQYLLGTSISNLNVFSDDELSCFSNDGVCFDLGRNIFNWYANFNGQNIEIGLIDFGLIDDSAEANCDNYFVSNCWCASDGFGNLLFIDHNVDSKSGCLELCNYTNGVGCCQWSDTGEFCMGFTEKDGFTCDDSLDDYAALSCEDACVDDLWMPSSSSYCNDETFVQTSNCGSTRTVYGNVNCEDDFTVGEDCYASYYEKLGPEYWDPYNMDTDEW